MRSLNVQVSRVPRLILYGYKIMLVDSGAAAGGRGGTSS